MNVFRLRNQRIGCWTLAALFALALILRCYALNAPLLDYHSWRQADTAAIARNFMRNGYRLLYPQVDWGGLTAGYVESEFPLYSFSLASLYALYGLHEWLGRLFTAIAASAAVGALYGCARPLVGRRAALYSSIMLMLMPFALYFGRTVMPDSLMLLAAILAIWSFWHWLSQPSFRKFLLALVCGTLAPLAKTPNLVIVIVPLVYMIWSIRPSRKIWPLLSCYAVCFTLPSLLWIWHAHTLPLDPQLSFGIGEKLFDLRLLVDVQFYLLLAHWSVENIITWAGLPLLLLGLISTTFDYRRAYHHRSQDHAPPNSESPALVPLLPHAWLAGVLLFLLAGAAGVVGQDYYILPLAGPFAWFAGIGLDRLQRQLEAHANNHIHKITETGKSAARGEYYTLLSRLIPIGTLTTVAVSSFVRVAPLYQTADFYQTLGHRVNLALPANAKVGIIAPAVSEILYYGDRQGWRLDPGVIVPGGLSSLSPDLHIRYVLICDPWLTERRAVLTDAIRQYRRIPIGPYALLLDLSKPGIHQNSEMIWETGHIIIEPFLSAWHTYGGVSDLGYPLSDTIDSSEGRIQYFEKGLLIRHGSKIIRAPVGRLLAEAQGWRPHPTDVGDMFAELWQQSGGKGSFGPAITPVVDTKDGGKVQYFENGTIEIKPGEAPSIGASGRQLLIARGLSEERQIELAAPS